ncbi:FAD-dependent oxidoreductase [Nocardia cyriacigeorgica]|uniref:NAD(P)/FAD-dependent oxidoreductase n=1 Tax=Nocardia cyriacigeorgica TaxID=135487 RepID=UPI0018939DA5|nr:FAD-binding oxidoreductase [Nocardia cyriacigeorgica]MBF6320344.1 FAD-dependent oxidoreductase [Nocardia cyriacigeorgica]MBF6534170.1 FAD-dependent oxidoreductase [Nocardia cyriacigeorgica]
MAIDVDCVIVGGGITGLMTAVRLAKSGCRVQLIERDLLGAGATTSNHGLIHSGALYARWHPEIVAACRQAQLAFRASFPECLVAAEPCWYFATSKTVHTYQTLWRSLGIAYRPVDRRELSAVVQAEGRDVAACAIDEVVIDTRALLAALAARCIDLGVEVSVGLTADQILIGNGRVRGVRTGEGSVRARWVVVCAGIGTRDLLDRAGSMVGAELASRLEMLTAYRGTLTRPVIGLEFGWPALAPAAVAGTVLASRYGGVQRTVQRRERWPVPTAEAAALDRELGEWIAPGVIDHADPVAWVCSKTEHTTRDRDQWGTCPNYTVIDHHRREQIDGLWTVLPGKMTLALHASREVAAALTGQKQTLGVNSGPCGDPDHARELVGKSPWAVHLQVQAQ